jgi:hypothetical protein
VYWYRKASEGGSPTGISGEGIGTGELGKPGELLWILCIDNLARTPYTKTLKGLRTSKGSQEKIFLPVEFQSPGALTAVACPVSKIRVKQQVSQSANSRRLLANYALRQGRFDKGASKIRTCGHLAVPPNLLGAPSLCMQWSPALPQKIGLAKVFFLIF